MTGRRTGDVPGAARAHVDWVPGAGIVAAAVGAGAVLGYTAGAGHPPLYLSLTVCTLVAVLAVVAWRRKRAPVALDLGPTRPAPHATTPPPAPLPFDLARDRRTDAQKYVM